MLSKGTVSALCGQLKHDFDWWEDGDPSDVDLPSGCCDGI